MFYFLWYLVICINSINGDSVFTQCKWRRWLGLWTFHFTWQIHLAML